MYYRPSTFRRFVAQCIDGIMALLIFAPLLVQIFLNWIADGTLHLDLYFCLLTFASHIFFLFISYGFFGATVGKWLMGLRLVTVNEGEIGLVQSFLRVLADQLRWFFGWGLFCLALVRFDRRHVSDWMAETKVVQLVPETGFPRRYVLTGLGLCLLLSFEGWRSVQARWKHVELRDKQIYFEVQ